MKYTAAAVFVLVTTLACKVYADDLGIDTETQTTDWNAGNFPNLKYPLPLSENVTTPLYNINTRDKRQTSPTGTPALEQNFLYFANRRFLVHINRNGTGLQAFTLSNTSNAVAVDFDVRLGYMMWSDVANKVIFAARLNGTGVSILVNSSINVPDGLAWDWVNKKLYWTDAADKDIEVIDPLTFHRKLLISTGNTTIPRAIVLDPQNKRMYWTDWGTVAKIERASMDGTSREVLHNTNLVWPNALTLDYDTQILYWMDAQLDKFESSNADGSNRRLLSTTHIYHPFGITLYQNRFYWTDWRLNAVLTAPINRPAAVGVVIRYLTLDPMGICVVSLDRQPAAVNPCARNNGNCSHLCLLSTTSGGRTCACPDGRALRLAANLRDCISSLPTQPPTTTATVTPTSSCLPACQNGGACIATNLCSCPTGWTGSYCQTPVCNPSCLNGGRCTAPNVCQCTSDWEGDYCQNAICFRPSGCLNGGHCISPGHCSCAAGWTGVNCGTPQCQVGCINGNCIGPNNCSCHTGWTGFRCDQAICFPPDGCRNNGHCVSPGICSCARGWNGAKCQNAICSPSCRNHGLCIYPNICFCSSGWRGTICNIAECFPPCANGGTCVRPGTCVCPLGWHGFRCENARSFG